MYKNNFRDGIVLMLKGWRHTLKNIKFVALWGVISSIFTSVILLSCGWLLTNISNPLSFYISNSLAYNVIVAPIFLMAYIMTFLYQYKERQNASSIFKKNIKDFYLWCAVPILLFVASGLSMIFIGSMVIFYGLLAAGIVYLIFTGLAPLYVIKSHYSVAEANKESFTDVKSHIITFLPSCVMNGLVLFGLFKLLDWAISLASIHSNTTAMILVIAVSLAKPLLYAVPLFNMLNAISDFQKNNQNPMRHDDYVEVGDSY